MEGLLPKVKEKGVLNKISLFVAEPMNINKLLTEDGLSKKVENKITKLDYPNLYKLKNSGYYEDFSFFISDMQRLPYYENKMIDINIFMSALEKLAGNKKLYEYGEIPEEFGENEKTMLKTFKKYGFIPYEQKGGKYTRCKTMTRKYSRCKNRCITGTRYCKMHKCQDCPNRCMRGGKCKKHLKQKGGLFGMKKKQEYNINDYEIIEYYGDEVEENEEIIEDLIKNNICNQKELSQLLELRDKNGFIVKKDDKYLGIVIFSEKIGYIKLDIICISNDKLHITDILLKQVEKYAKENGYKKIESKIIDNKYFKKNGFKKNKNILEKKIN